MKVMNAVAAAVVAASVSAPAAAITTVSDFGVDVAELTPVVNEFRTLLGGNLNTGAANFAGGRREINWDGVPDTSADPHFIASNFFNTGTGGRARGLEFHNAGNKFMVSSTLASGEPVAFGYPGDFTPFSGERMFAPIDSLVTEVTFFDPIRPGVQATTRGFGAVFEDVEKRGSKLSYYGVGGELLLTLDVPRDGNGSLSFAGAVFDSAVVAKVVIISGLSVLAADGSFNNPGGDGVVMDDFIYGEPVPVPEPSTYAMLGLGLAGLALMRRRTRA